MAYLARTDPRQRFQVQQEGTGGASAQVPGAAPGASPVSPPSSGGAFQAVRGFFEANRASADDTAQRALGNAEERAQEAVDLAGQSAEMPENAGGYETASRATEARDDALERINASGTQSGIEALLSQGKDATYTQGQRAADAAIAGRSEALRSAQEKWGGTLSALQPTYAPGLERPGDPGPAPEVLPALNPEQMWEYQKTGQLDAYLKAYTERQQAYEEWKKKKEAYDKALRDYNERTSDKKDERVGSNQDRQDGE